VAPLINKIPKIGRWLNFRLLIADYRGRHQFSEAILKEWAILDSFDMISPAYDQPQTLETVQAWFQQANLAEVEVHYGQNGIEGRGVKPHQWSALDHLASELKCSRFIAGDQREA
jgi:hypothetical protein